MSKVDLYLGRGGRNRNADLTACLIRGCWPADKPLKPECSFEMADLVKFMVLYCEPFLYCSLKYLTMMDQRSNWVTSILMG